MKCHDEPYENNSFQLVDPGSFNKFNKEAWRRGNKFRNLETARERWTERIEKFIEDRDLVKAFHEDKEDRLESIAIELWKLKNVDEVCCSEPKDDGKVKKSVEDVLSDLKAQAEAKEEQNRQMKLLKRQECFLVSLDLKGKSNEEEAIEKHRKKDELRSGLLAQIKDNCKRNHCANELALMEGACMVEKDIQLLKEMQAMLECL